VVIFLICLIGERLFLIANHGTFSLQQCETTVSKIPGFMSTGAMYDRSGVMPLKDFVKLNAIGYRMRHIGIIDEADLTWSINLLNVNAGENNRADEIRRAYVLSIFRFYVDLKTTSNKQKTEISRAIVPLLQLDDSLGIDTSEALHVADMLRDDTLIPIITPLLHSSSSQIRLGAEKVLSDYGMSLKTAQEAQAR
jgi:hypothetical protein